jgi:TonB family protein
MSKKTLIFLLFAAFCSLQNAHAQMNCTELKTRIDNAFKDNNSMRIEYWSRDRNIYVDYEQDTQANTHLVVRSTGKKPLRQVVIGIKRQQYFKSDRMGGVKLKYDWLEEIPANFDKNAWIDSCKSANSVFSQPFKNCFLSKDKTLSGTPYSVYSIEISQDTFDVWINKTTDKLERITGENKAKIVRFEWLFNIPFTISAPPIKSEDNPDFAMNMFPPSYSFDEFDGTERVFNVVDKLPEFKGGQMQMFRFLANNIKYPKYARGNGIEGTIYIGFVVEKNGILSNINIKRGVSDDCNEEALRVLKLMQGKWDAGSFNGQKVRVAFTLPIKFKLE